MKKITLLKIVCAIAVLFSTTMSYGQCPINYVANAGAGTITFEFDSGNDAKSEQSACNFVREHGGTGILSCSGGSITVAGITYNYTGNDGGGSGPITLTYTATATLTSIPTNIEIAEGIDCSQTSDNGCFTIYFQDIYTGENCNSSNSDFSFTINDIGHGNLECVY